MSSSTTIYDLPTELLTATLASFSTPELLPLTLVSHRFHAIILRIFYTRLLITTSIKTHQLILECFHPSAKITEPHLFCVYEGTTIGPDGSLIAQHAGEKDKTGDKDPIKQQDIFAGVPEAQKLARLRSLYSRFRLELPRIEAKVTKPFVNGGLRGTERVIYSNRPGGASSGEEGGGEEQADPNDAAVPLPFRVVTLDEYESFSQLVSVVSLTQPGPRGFRSVVTIKEGIIRVKRDWLSKQAELLIEDHCSDNKHDTLSRVLWLDAANQTIGIRVRVKRRQWKHNAPILIRADVADDEIAVSYQVDFEGV